MLSPNLTANIFYDVEKRHLNYNIKKVAAYRFTSVVYFYNCNCLSNKFKLKNSFESTVLSQNILEISGGGFHSKIEDTI